MKEYASSVSPKGQITLPAEVRRQLGIKPKDTVALHLVDKEILVRPARSRLEEIYQSVPALSQPLSDREISDIAWEEHTEEVARDEQ